MRRIAIPRWLYPGMHLKRWLLLIFAGITILALGTATFRVDQAIAALVILVTTSLTLLRVFGWIEHRVAPWRHAREVD